MRSRWVDETPRVIGHRGSPREAIENTLASFEACVRQRIPAVELDARLSADGVVVVHHDAELGRVVAGPERVEDLAADELHARGVPRLDEVLALDLLVNVEIKSDAQAAAQLPAKVLEVVRKADALDRVLVTSFDHELAETYARLANVPGGAILPYAPDPDDLASFPRLRFVALAEDAALPEAMELIRALDRDVLVWTVNDETSAKRLIAEGAAGVITDRPGPLARSLA